MPKTDRTNAERQARWRARQAEKLAELERIAKTSNQDETETETIRLKAENERLRVALREGTSELARLDDENQRLRVELARLKQDAKPKPTRTRKKKPA